MKHIAAAIVVVATLTCAFLARMHLPYNEADGWNGMALIAVLAFVFLVFRRDES